MAIVSELLASLGIDPREFDKGLRSAERKLRQASANLEAVGTRLTAGVTAPIVGVGTAAVASFSSFDKALNQSAAIISGAEDRMEELGEAARAVARDTTFSAAQSAEAFFFLASAGLDVDQSLSALPQVAQFAQAGMFDLALATDLLTDAQSALGLTSKDAAQNLENLTRVSDVLVKANTLANATVQQFSEALTNQAAASARQVGIEIEEVVAVLAAFADQGVKGAEAGTKFSIVLRDLQTKAIRNAGAFNALGVEVFDGVGNINSMVDILRDLEEQLGGASAEIQKATLLQLGFADKSVGALQQLIGLSDQIETYEKGLREAGGTTEEVAQKQLQSFANQMELLRGRIVDVAIELGSQLVPILEKMVPFVDAVLQTVRGLVAGFSELSDGTKTWIVSIVGLVAALGPLSLALGAALRTLSSLSVLLRTGFSAIVPGGILLVGLGLLVEHMFRAKAAAIETERAFADFGRRLESNSLDALNRLGGELFESFQKATSEVQRLQGEIERVGTTGSPLARSAILRRLREELAAAEKKVFDFDVLLGEVVRKINSLSSGAPKRTIDLGLPGGESSLRPDGAAAAVFTGDQFGGGLQGFIDANRAATDEVSRLYQDLFEARKALDEQGTIEAEAALQRFRDANQSVLSTSASLWAEWALRVSDSMKFVTELGIKTFDSLAQGIGQAFAQAIVSGADFGEAMLRLFQRVLSSLIAEVIAFVIKFIALKVAQIVFNILTEESSKGGIVGFLIALAALPALIGAAFALSRSQGGKAQSAVALQTGGLVQAEGLALLHPGEVVATPQEVKNVLGSGGGGNMKQEIQVFLDGEMVGEASVRHMPKILRVQGITI